MKKVGTILLFIIVLELVLGGGGRFIAFGNVSLRMVLFGMAMVYTSWSFVKGQTIPAPFVWLLIIFLSALVFSTIWGYFGHAAISLIFEDVKPLAYFLMLPFFALVLKDEDIVEKLLLVYIYAPIFLAASYLVILLMLNTGYIDFISFYRATAITEELFYRGEIAFFYKGFIFLCVGLVFLYFLKPKFYKFYIVLLSLAVFLTFTRGFIFALGLTSIAWFIMKNEEARIKMTKIFIVGICVVLIVFKGAFFYSEMSRIIYTSQIRTDYTKDFAPDKMLGDRKFSNNERKTQLNQVIEQTTLHSSLIGHGFGIGVPVRPVHMEIAYLEIFHKQGIFGLFVWALIFYFLFRYYRSALKKNAPVAHAFFFGSVFIFFQSVTNQYFNNPIGMSFILISMVILHKIKENYE